MAKTMKSDLKKELKEARSFSIIIGLCILIGTPPTFCLILNVMPSINNILFMISAFSLYFFLISLAGMVIRIYRIMIFSNEFIYKAKEELTNNE